MSNSDSYIEIPCLEVEQPIGQFYLGKIMWQDLIKICFNDIRRIEKEEKNEVELYFGIQRELSKKRIEDISEYVTNIDATFPSSIILSINSKEYLNRDKSESIENVFYDMTSRMMRIRKNEKIAKIIDGQHRVYGLQKGFESLKNPPIFELIITIFVDMDLDNQSMVFATINKAQTKVNKSLVYDLFEFAKTRSPQRAAHNIVKLLNSYPDSPFKDKIKILGKADDKEKETITQATLVESILEYISDNPMRDRDILKRGQRLDLLNLKNKKELETLRKRIFRNLFIENKEANIAKIIWNYFDSVKNKWGSAWNNNDLILNKSTGVIALMRFLRPSYLSFNKLDQIISIEEFETIFAKINIDGAEFTTDNYKPGGSGQAKLFSQLMEMSDLRYN